MNAPYQVYDLGCCALSDKTIVFCLDKLGVAWPIMPNEIAGEIVMFVCIAITSLHKTFLPLDRY